MCVGGKRRLAAQLEQCGSRLRRVDTCHPVENARVNLEGDDHRGSVAKQHLCQSNTYVKATPGVGSINFYTVDFGGAFFNWSYCVRCVLSNTLVLRCMVFCFVSRKLIWLCSIYLPLGFQNSTPCVSACTVHSVARQQHPCPSVGPVNRW